MSAFLRKLRKGKMFQEDRLCTAKSDTSRDGLAVIQSKKDSFSPRRFFRPVPRVTERDLEQLHHRIDKLLAKIDDNDTEGTQIEEDECVVCLAAKATMQTYPCGHKIVCRKCFIKTIQVAVTQRCLPLRCVICRTGILKVRQNTTQSKSKRSCQTANGLRLFGRSKSSKFLPKGK